MVFSDYTSLAFEELRGSPKKESTTTGPTEGKTARILVIYTGGTIGMKKDGNNAYTVVPNYFARALKKLPMLHDEDYVEGEEFEFGDDKNHAVYSQFPQLVMPVSKMGKRIVYYINELNPILDSSNMSMYHWSLIAKEVKHHYQYFDSFVILHGTDTMAYTASALSYMFENLDKTVVVTGSQIPIFEQRSDGQGNLIGALEIAGHFIIPEVTLFFNNKLFRGNRCQKVSSSDIDAFDSPNLAALAKLGTEIDISWEAVLPNNTFKPFHVQEEMSENVGLLQLFPGINTQIVRACLSAPMQGVVIVSFGAGNVPSGRPDLMEEFRAAAERGVLLVNITQCAKGSVSDAYAAGKVLFDIGVIPGHDMTPEAALTKMSYVLGKPGLSPSEQKNLLASNICGEMSSPQHVESIDLANRKQELIDLTRLNSLCEALLPIVLSCTEDVNTLDKIPSIQEVNIFDHQPTLKDPITAKMMLSRSLSAPKLEKKQYVWRGEKVKSLNTMQLKKKLNALDNFISNILKTRNINSCYGQKPLAKALRYNELANRMLDVSCQNPKFGSWNELSVFEDVNCNNQINCKMNCG